MPETVCKKVGYGPKCSDTRFPQAVAEKNDCISQGQIRCRERYWQCVLDRSKHLDIRIPPANTFGSGVGVSSIKPMRQWGSYKRRPTPRPQAIEPFDKYFYWSQRTSPVAESLKDIECFSEIQCFEEIRDCFCDSLAGWICHSCPDPLPKPVDPKVDPTKPDPKQPPPPNPLKPDLASQYANVIPIFFGSVKLSANAIYIKKGQIKDTVDITAGIGRGCPSYLTSVRMNGYNVFDRTIANTSIPLELADTEFVYEQGLETDKIDPTSTENFGYVPAYRGLANVRIKNIPGRFFRTAMPTMTFSVSTGLASASPYAETSTSVSGAQDILDYDGASNEVSVLFPNEVRRLKLSDYTTVNVNSFPTASVKSFKSENSPDIIYIDTTGTAQVIIDSHLSSANQSFGTLSIGDIISIRAAIVLNVGSFLFVSKSNAAGVTTVYRINRQIGVTDTVSYNFPVDLKQTFFGVDSGVLRLYAITQTAGAGVYLSHIALVDALGFAVTPAVFTFSTALTIEPFAVSFKRNNAEEVIIRTSSRQLIVNYLTNTVITPISTLGTNPANSVFQSDRTTSSTFAFVNPTGTVVKSNNGVGETNSITVSLPLTNTRQIFGAHADTLHYVNASAILTKVAPTLLTQSSTTLSSVLKALGIIVNIPILASTDYALPGYVIRSDVTVAQILYSLSEYFSLEATSLSEAITLHSRFSTVTTLVPYQQHLNLIENYESSSVDKTPASVEVHYFDNTLNGQEQKQTVSLNFFSESDYSHSNELYTTSFEIYLTPTQARTAAERILYTKTDNSNTTATFNLPLGWVRVTPGDVLILGSLRLFVTSVNINLDTNDQVITTKSRVAVLDEVTISGTTGTVNPDTFISDSPSTDYIEDYPIVFDAPPPRYSASKTLLYGRIGAGVLATNLDIVQTMEYTLDSVPLIRTIPTALKRVVSGATTTALASTVRPFTSDFISQVNVVFDTDVSTELAPATQDQLYVDPKLNLVLVGKEWIQFGDFTLQSDNKTATLSRLRRSCFGTENVIHGASERVYLYHADSMKDIDVASKNATVETLSTSLRITSQIRTDTKLLAYDYLKELSLQHVTISRYPLRYDQPGLSGSYLLDGGGFNGVRQTRIDTQVYFRDPFSYTFTNDWTHPLYDRNGEKYGLVLVDSYNPATINAILLADAGEFVTPDDIRNSVFGALNFDLSYINYLNIGDPGYYPPNNPSKKVDMALKWVYYSYDTTSGVKRIRNHYLIDIPTSFITFKRAIVTKT
jgi:hypothetical protein